MQLLMYNVLYDAPVPDLEHLVNLLLMACGKCSNIYMCVYRIYVWCYTCVYIVSIVTAPVLPYHCSI